MKAVIWPLPKIQKIFDYLIGSNIFTTLDLFSGYWQIRQDEECKEKTSLTCRFGTFYFELMPFGWMNAPSTSQQMMNEILGDLPFIRVYLDIVVIFSWTIEEHVGHFDKILQISAQQILRIKIPKCAQV